jgi:signal transduction histidine kinase/CheY-like chemotaxis protein
MSSSQRADNINLFYQWLILISVLLMLGSFIGYNLFKEYQNIDNSERLRLSAQTEIVEKNITPQLILTYNLIDKIIHYLPSWRAENDGYKHANNVLKLIDGAAVGINPIIIIQADGKAISSSNEKLIGMNFAQREYFKTAIKNPDPRILHVSAPFKTVLNTYVISLFRTITGPHGEFAGIVIVSAVPEYFSTLLDSVRYTPDMWSCIIHGNGKLFLVSPENTNITNNDLDKPGTFFARHMASGKTSNVFTGTASSTGKKSMMALRTIYLTNPPTDKPLVVAAARDMQALFSSWRTNAYMQSLLFGVVTIACSLGLIIIQRRQRIQLFERKMAEQSLLQERDLSLDILKAQPAGIYRIRVFAPETWENDAWRNSGNAPYVMELITESFCNILGITKGAFEHTPGILLDMVHPDDKEGFAKMNEDANANLNKFVWEGRLLINGKIRWVVFQSLPRPLENGDVLWTGALMDITDRKKIEEEKYTLEQQFQHTQKLESLGVLSGGIAHDFNNILAVIIGNCSLALLHKENASEYIPDIGTAAERAAELCRQMMAYAGKAQLVQTNVNLRSLVEGIVDMLKRTIPQNAEIKLDNSTDFPFIKGDASQLNQIVMNLIINASEAIGKEQGEIEVSLTEITISEDKPCRDYNGNTISPGTYVCLEVTDNGCGMDEETKWRIFEPFYTTKFSGRGLGMSAVLGIIMSHKGALQLHSQIGQGTTFKAYLPAQSSVSDNDVKVLQTTQTPWQGSGTILLVEDENKVRHIAKRMLEFLGFTVVEAVNGKEALNLYQMYALEIALVLTDVGMPIMDGYALFNMLKQINPALPIIISSGFGDADVTSKIDYDDITGIISKPYTLAKLGDVLKNVLDRASTA